MCGVKLCMFEVSLAYPRSHCIDCCLCIFFFSIDYH